jgi:ATP-binding cassette subfamily B protein RaxB
MCNGARSSLLEDRLGETIASFDEGIYMTRVRLCAHLAQIHADIERMPMGYESLVGDMGSTLTRAGSPFYNSA